jgi:hypothetical protein
MGGNASRLVAWPSPRAQLYAYRVGRGRTQQRTWSLGMNSVAWSSGSVRGLRGPTRLRAAIQVVRGVSAWARGRRTPGATAASATGSRESTGCGQA